MSSLYPLQRKVTERAPKVSQELAANLLGVVLSWGITYAGYRAFLALLELGSGNGTIFQSGVGEACAKALAARHERAPRLSGHEAQLSGSVVDPEALASTLDDVGGLEAIVEELRDLVVWPLRHPGAFAGASKLARAPRGVLLYGEPGTGKTLVARGLARESGAALMDVRVSTLADKYYGESNKLVAATFSLARKLAPAVVFLDEVDGLLRSRSSGETEVTVSVKAEFMSHLDGLLVAPDEAERRIVLLKKRLMTEPQEHFRAADDVSPALEFWGWTLGSLRDANWGKVQTMTAVADQFEEGPLRDLVWKVLSWLFVLQLTGPRRCCRRGMFADEHGFGRPPRSGGRRGLHSEPWTSPKRTTTSRSGSSRARPACGSRRTPSRSSSATSSTRARRSS